MDWRHDKRWSDRFIPEIKRILGEQLIEVANDTEDQQHNTDLISLRLPGDVRFACRIRKHGYLANYADEFTLRCSRPSGRDTEIDKLLAGWGDYLFYGFADEAEQALAAWFIGDLNVFREWISWHFPAKGYWPGELKENFDGSSKFMAFDVNEVRRDFVVARKVATESRGLVHGLS